MTEAASGKGPDESKGATPGARLHARWLEEIRLYESNAEPWETKSKKIIRRYKNRRNTAKEDKASRFNILWSNIQTLKPALYMARPKPDIERRWRDKDDLGRSTSMVLERSITYFVNEDYDSICNQVVLDRLLSGRGTAWVRYEPHFKDAEVEGNDEVRDDGEQVTDDADVEDDGLEPEQIVADETICFDYVHWQDFGHPFARTWEELGAAWRKVYLSRKQLCERFGDAVGDKITLDYTPKDLKDTKVKVVGQQATIYEIWDKSAKRVYWLHKDHPEILEQKDDPLRLTGFFPFPKPLYATLANDDLIPVPDYEEYQDQAIELDTLTQRIAAIVRCVKVAGVYDASAQALSRLLSEGTENQLIPVEQWAMFAQKGGMTGVMEFMPIKEIAETLLSLYEARDKVKADLYEITGMADIIRGASDAEETATAQKIKSQFASIRLTEMQHDVKRFCCDLVKIGSEIIAEHFSLETLKRISGIRLLNAQDKQLIQMRQQAPPAPPQPGMPPQAPPPMPLPPELAKLDAEEIGELMEQPTWEEVEQLLRDEKIISYKIDIETESTLKSDQEQDKQERIQFLEAAGKFIEMSTKIEQPEIAPLLGKMLMFGVRGFKIGKELESAFELTIRKMEKAAENPQPKPDPEMAKVQGQLQIQQAQLQGDIEAEKARMAAEQQKVTLEHQQAMAQIAAESQRDQHKAQLDAQLAQHQAQVDSQADIAKSQAEGQIKLSIAKMDNEAKILVAQIAAKAQLDAATLSANSNEYKAELSAKAASSSAAQSGT